MMEKVQKLDHSNKAPSSKIFTDELCSFGCKNVRPNNDKYQYNTMNVDYNDF
jgi:hypothetical protein